MSLSQSQTSSISQSLTGFCLYEDCCWADVCGAGGGGGGGVVVEAAGVGGACFSVAVVARADAPGVGGASVVDMAGGVSGTLQNRREVLLCKEFCRKTKETYDMYKSKM